MYRKEIVNQLSNLIHQNAPDARVILFGSEARGDAMPDSDIDLLILLNKDKVSLRERQSITYLLYDVELETGILINPLVIPLSIWESKYKITPFYQNILREGKLI
jgi:predicted nucleotidyltransferase